MTRRPYAKPAVTTREPCSFPGCDRMADLNGRGQSNGMCRGHRRQKQLGRPMTPLRRWFRHRAPSYRASARARLQPYVLKYADAVTDGDERRAWNELMKQFWMYCRDVQNSRRNARVEGRSRRSADKR